MGIFSSIKIARLKSEIKKNDKSLKNGIDSLCEIIGLDTISMGCQRKTELDYLAIVTVMSAAMEKNKNEKSILCNSSVACCDSVFFFAFMVRFLCMDHTYSSVDKFTDEYFEKVKRGAMQLYGLPPVIFGRMFDNRILFYDRVCRSKLTYGDRVCAVLEEFKSILNYDEAHGYVPYSEDSPLIVIDFFIKGVRDQEVDDFFFSIPEQVEPFLSRVEEEIIKSRK